MYSRIFPIIVLLVLASSSTADTTDTANIECLKRLENDTKIGDSVTVFTIDNRTLRGQRPIVNLQSSLLYMRSIAAPDARDDITVPFDSINEITYRRPSPARMGLTLLGLTVGAVAGAVIGVALAPEPEHWLDMPEIQTGVIGGIIGGLIGAAAGNMIGSRMTVEVRLKCW